MSLKKPTLHAVCTDLKNILQKILSESHDSSISYSWISKESSDLLFPALTYLRFLNDEGFLEINRVEDRATITSMGFDALEDDEELRHRASEEFADRIEVHGLDEDSSDAESYTIESSKKSEPKPEMIRYERIEEIGTGGIGTVYLALQKPLNRKVALKEIREIFNVFAGVQRDDIIARFSKIICAQASLDHPNIIPLVDLVVHEDFPYVVMRYAQNGNLRRLIEAEGRPPLEIALKYFLQILHAFNSAHQNGIHHGGVKPENIVLDSSGNAMVTDFGLSSVADLDTNKGNQVFVGVGTVAYMSPEQFGNPNKSSVQSDIYSLGILLYEMLTGKMPGRRSPMPSSFYPDIPRKLDDIFDKMSMDDPGERYQSVNDILIDIYSCSSIMKVLDKRTGFQFLRDPLTYGAVGLSELEGDPSDFAFDTPTPSFIPEDEGHPTHAEDHSITHHTSFSDDDDVDAHTSSHKSDDLLGKLDRYSGMFEEDQNDMYDEFDSEQPNPAQE